MTGTSWHTRRTGLGMMSVNLEYGLEITYWKIQLYVIYQYNQERIYRKQCEPKV